MLSFHQLLLRKFLLVFSVLFFILGFIVYTWAENFYIEQTKQGLLDDIKIIALNINSTKNLDILAKNVKKNLGLRLTLIAPDGHILAESDKDKTKMDNHRYRAEILQANRQKYGYKIRHSKTLNKKLLYVAKKVPYKESYIYIRMAKKTQNIYGHILFLGEEIVAILIIFFSILFTLIYKISKNLEHEVQKIVTFVKSLTKKNKITYIQSSYSIEFNKITALLTKVSQILVKKEKQKSKFTSRLQSSNKQKDDIISAISHEFKNPIAVINGYSQTLLDDANINPNIRQKFLKKIYNNGIKLSELIDTLRLSSKLDSGQQEMKFKNCNLNKLINETVENLKVTYPRREVIIDSQDEITIKADPALLSIVITNLIENAFKYSEDEVLITLNAKGFSITDNGIGISESHLENITSKFYRVNENTWNNSLGLGLFIVSNILKLHHFTLDIKSKENEGSTFNVIFL